MRVLIAAATAATLLVSSAFAATDSVAPLAPGKPAGVKKAQLAESSTLLWVLGAGLVIGGIALIATQDGDNNTPSTGGGSSSSSSSP